MERLDSRSPPRHRLGLPVSSLHHSGPLDNHNRPLHHLVLPLSHSPLLRRLVLLASQLLHLLWLQTSPPNQYLEPNQLLPSPRLSLLNLSSTSLLISQPEDLIRKSLSRPRVRAPLRQLVFHQVYSRSVLLNRTPPSPDPARWQTEAHLG